MKRLVFMVVLLVRSIGTRECECECECESEWQLVPRPHSVSVSEFGAIGDGITINTVAFQNAIFYLKSFGDKGGAQLYVPAGKWVIGCITLTSHLTLFLEKDALILASQEESHWDVIEPLPSYGQGLEVHGRRYRSLISGQNLIDVVITGNNGTIDGQGSVWWERVNARTLNYSRPHLVEFIASDNVVVSNLTFLNAPAWNIHPVYCRYLGSLSPARLKPLNGSYSPRASTRIAIRQRANCPSHFLVQNITIYSPPDSPHTCGIVPDSTEHVCVENSNISIGHDAVALKSGWDEYGIKYGKPTTNVHIRGVRLQSFSGSGVAFGSEMSGGISSVLVERIQVHASKIGIELKTAIGRGGYVKGIFVSDVYMRHVGQGIKATGHCNSHPDDEFDPHALPVVSEITFRDIVGVNITMAGYFLGIEELPFTSICLSNVSFSLDSDTSASWHCRDVLGSSIDVLPKPCPELVSSSRDCFVFSRSSSRVVEL